MPRGFGPINEENPHIYSRIPSTQIRKTGNVHKFVVWGNKDGTKAPQVKKDLIPGFYVVMKEFDDIFRRGAG